MTGMGQPTKRERHLANVISEAVNASGLTVGEVASRAQVPVSTLRSAFAGAGSFAFSEICEIAHALDMKPSTLFWRAEQP